MSPKVDCEEPALGNSNAAQSRMHNQVNPIGKFVFRKVMASPDSDDARPQIKFEMRDSRTDVTSVGIESPIVCHDRRHPEEKDSA
jgi:hypothetical protein